MGPSNIVGCMSASAEDVTPKSGCCTAAACWLLVGVAEAESAPLLAAEQLPAAVVNELQLGGSWDDDSFRYGG